MPATTSTVTVGEVVDELDERLDEISRKADQADDPQEQQTLDQQGVRLDQRLAAFEELVAEYDRNAQFEVAELTLDERMRFNDLLEAAREQAEQQQAFETGPAMRDVFFTAAGVVDAPWLEGDEAMYERAAALRSEEIGVDWRVMQYLKEQVTEANSKGNPERRSYAERRAESQSRNGRN
mgnify:CR=1 FL=1